ncbi:hypothetical protein AAFG07_17035 [Bradyrhizobium sp. B097]
MNVVRFGEAPAYTAPGHHDMAMVRLHRGVDEHRLSSANIHWYCRA